MGDCKNYIYILEIVKVQSISVAAENLGISQPALSKYVKKVETEYGAEIFDRNTNPISLTQAGTYYVEAAKKILDVKQQLEKQIQELDSRRNKEIRIGISPSRAPYLLPPVLKEFTKKYPKVHVLIDEGTTRELAEKLTQGELDLIVSLLNDETEIFEHVNLFEEHVCLAVPEDKHGKSVKELLECIPFITAGKGQVLWHFLKENQEKFGNHNDIVECQNMSTALALVEQGIGMTLVPSYMRDYGRDKKIRYVSLRELCETERRQVSIFFRKEQFLSEVEKEFIRISVDMINK